MVTLTTQSTYQRAPVSDQLLRAAQLRAAELQRPVLVAATTGRSAAIDATGQRIAESKLYGADLLVAQVELTSGDTPFARFGDLLTVAIAGIMLVASARAAAGTSVLHGRAPSGLKRGPGSPPRAGRWWWPAPPGGGAGHHRLRHRAVVGSPLWRS